MLTLYGTLIGDACGSPYEGGMVTGNTIGSYTDDTEQAYGIALWLKQGDWTPPSLTQILKSVYTGPHRGYGGNTISFLEGVPHRKDSFGNGSAMRVAAVGEILEMEDQVIEIASLQSRLTHDHPEAIAGAVTIALLAFYIKKGWDPHKVKDKYLDVLFPEEGRRYDCSLLAAESVPVAVQAFLEEHSFEDTLHRALSFGGDTDTIAAMACSLAAMKYGIPESLLKQVAKAHPDNQKMITKINQLSL